MPSYFQGISVKSNRIIYTASGFAKSNLLYLQEVGELQALKPHTNSREGLISFLFFTVTEGTGSLIYNNQLYHLNTGDCVFIDCRKAYSQASTPEHLWHLQWAHFYGANLNGIYEKYVERGGGPVFTPKDSSSFSELLTALLTIAGSEDYIRDMKINEKIASLLTLIMAESWHPEKNIHLNTKKQSLHYIKTYLEEHYQEKITLEQLSAEFYINKFYLSRIFKNQFGTTVLSYLEQIRITHAKQLLRFSDMTVEEIGHKIGIDEPGYFNRVFKKLEGITPGEYRKRW
jgi:AraC-like DNA-binding protein